MSEVKVRITAQNQTQTGFQSVLSDAKRTATQVRQTFSQAATTPATGVGAGGGSVLFGPNMTVDDWLAQAERNIEENLKKRKALRESMKESAGAGSQGGGTIAPVGGGLVRFVGAATAAVGVGMFLNRTIEAVGERFKSVTQASDQFSNSVQKIGQASSISELVNGLNSANSEFSALQKKADDFKDLKFTFESIANNLANVFSGGALFRAIDDSVQSGAREKALQTELSLARQLRDLREQTTAIQTGGDIEAIRRQQQNEQMREALRKGLEGSSPARIASALGRFDDVTAEREAVTQAERDRKRQEDNAEKERRSAKIDQDIRVRRARASGDEAALRQELMRQDITSALKSGATLGQAKDLAAIEAAQRAQQQMQSGAFKGSMGASSFQRIGFASNEFFDTRSKPETNFANLLKEMRKAADAAIRIEKKVKDGDLVLQSTSS
jgi:hypothetical protein